MAHSPLNPTLVFNTLTGNGTGPDVYRGVISMFHTGKGYGFITVSPGEDPFGSIPLGRIFFHVRAVVPRMTNNQVRLLMLDKNVQFSVGLSPKSGRQVAENVKLNTAPNNNPVVAPVIPPLLPAPMPVMNVTRPEPAPRQTITQLANAMRNGLNMTSINHAQTDDANGYIDFSQRAIEMGFRLDLVQIAAHAHNDFDLTRQNDGRPVIFETLEQFLSHICNLQEDEDRNVEKYVFETPENKSDDYRFNSWLTEAENMGFDCESVLEAFSQNGSFVTFQDLIEKVLTMETTEANNQPKKPVLSPQSPVESNETKLRNLRKQNQDLRDFFQCKVCFSYDSTLGFSPCGHLCCCVDCGQSQSTCPYCRQPAVSKFFRVPAENDRAIPQPRDDGFKTDAHEEIRILSRENREIEILRYCVICRTRDRAAHFAPCGHVVTCLACARTCTHCPACNGPVGQRIAVFFA